MASDSSYKAENFCFGDWAEFLTSQFRVGGMVTNSSLVSLDFPNFSLKIPHACVHSSHIIAIKLNFFIFLLWQGIYNTKWASLVVQTVKNLPAMQETRVQSLGRGDPLEEGIATHSSILAWRIPQTQEPGRLQPMGLQRVKATEATWYPHNRCIYNMGVPQEAQW